MKNQENSCRANHFGSCRGDFPKNGKTASSPSTVRTPSLHSQIQIIIQHGLEAAVLHVAVHRLDAAAVLYFELFVARVLFLRARIFRLVVADARGDAGGNLCRADFCDAVTECGGFAAGDRDADERQENPVGAENLAEFAFTDVARVDAAVVDNRAEARAAEAEFRMRIFAVDQIDVVCAPRMPPIRARSCASKR